MSQEVIIDHAWILDAMPHREGVEIWFKLPTGKILHGIYPYLPSFYVTFRATQHRDNFFRSDDEKYHYYATKLAEHEIISSIEVVKRRIHAEHTFYLQCLKITPQSLNCNSRGNFVKAHFTMPEDVFPEDLDIDKPVDWLYPVGVGG